MHASDWLAQAQKEFEESGIATARLDALVLMEDATGKDRGWLLAHPEHELERSEIVKLSKKCIQRADHTPLAYVRGKTEFYGREFIITPAVLEPRPESETMIDLLLELRLPGAPVIADIGTGSGALGITAGLELPNATVYGVDIDTKCLAVAQQNASKHGVAVAWHNGDFLDGLPADECPDVLLCNLPYVPDEFHINTAATHEPKIAIFGGADGLDHYRTMFGQIAARASAPGYVLTEALPPQHEALSAIARKHGYSLVGSSDFIQVFDRRS